jgi:hypothetical protein
VRRAGGRANEDEADDEQSIVASPCRLLAEGPVPKLVMANFLPGDNSGPSRDDG